MKQFTTPEIVEAFDNVEGIYLASGGTNTPPPPPPSDGNWTWSSRFAGHDTGSHSELYVSGSSKKACSGASITLTLIDGSVEISDVLDFNDWRFTMTYTSNAIYLSTNMSVNGNESLEASSMHVVFKHLVDGSKGAYYKNEGGHAVSENITSTAGVFRIDYH